MTEESRIRQPRTAFILFVNEQKARVFRANPEFDFRQCVQQLAPEWHRLAPDQRQKYFDLEKQDKERYQTQVAQQPEPTQNSKNIRPQTAMDFFVRGEEERMRYVDPSWDRMDHEPQLAQKWLQLPQEDKKDYQALEQEDATRCKLNKMRRKHQYKPRQAMSAYMFYVSHRRSEVVAKHPTLDFMSIGRILGQSWNCMTEEDKEPFVELHKQDVQRQKAEEFEYEQRMAEIERLDRELFIKIAKAQSEIDQEQSLVSRSQEQIEPTDANQSDANTTSHEAARETSPDMMPSDGKTDPNITAPDVLDDKGAQATTEACTAQVNHAAAQESTSNSAADEVSAVPDQGETWLPSCVLL